MTRQLRSAKQAIRQAGSELVRRYVGHEFARSRFKKHHERVTVADKASEKIILNILRKDFPDDAFLTEESGWKKRKGEYAWIIDPLDGTSNFVMHNPLFGISIARVHGDEVVLGVMYFPLLKRMYWAEKGMGARRDGKRISVSDLLVIPLATHLFCHGQSKKDIATALKLYSRYLNKNIRLRHLGSAAFELALVAEGHADSYTSVGIHAWDVAAGVCIAREAGATITTMQDNTWTVYSDTLLVANPKLHARVKTFIR